MLSELFHPMDVTVIVRILRPARWNLFCKNISYTRATSRSMGIYKANDCRLTTRELIGDQLAVHDIQRSSNLIVAESDFLV